MMNNNLKLMAIPELSGMHFFIPNYQRGYKWDKKQVYDLLGDLWHYFKPSQKGEFYCLQPIVVKKCSQETIQKYELPVLSTESITPKDEIIDKNTWYEVIDGQQRLTTIRILFRYYNLTQTLRPTDAKYDLFYATRPQLGKIFDNVNIDPETRAISLNSTYTDMNVDTEYIMDTFNNILNWFNDDNEVECSKMNEIVPFLSNLYMDQSKPKKVDVIWYEATDNLDARDIFERLNNLQVPLSSSELIRAMFLSSNAEYDKNEREYATDMSKLTELALLKKDKESKQSSINAKWDEIEHYLNNQDIWSFLTNDAIKSYRNKIELLFDIMSRKKEEGAEDRLYTYIWFERQRAEKGLWELWQDIIKSYVQIRSWYENRNYYHKIGYLAYVKGENILSELLKFTLTGNHKKSEFDSKLIEEIQKTFTNSNSINTWLYENNKDYANLKNLLLLYNVELINKSQMLEGRFSFKDYKAKERDDNGKKLAGWTLEHIHAQNSECLDQNKRQEWIDWATYTLKARRNMVNPSQEVKNFIKKLSLILQGDEGKRQIDNPKFTYQQIVKLFQEDLQLWSNNKPYIVEHQLSNLALLSGEINSSIGKGAFFIKQQRINHCIADGEYVPKGTQMVFMKHYYSLNSSEELLSRQLLTWDDEDRQNYLHDIEDKLIEYNFKF